MVYIIIDYVYHHVHIYCRKTYDGKYLVCLSYFPDTCTSRVNLVGRQTTLVTTKDNRAFVETNSRLFELIQIKG